MKLLLIATLFISGVLSAPFNNLLDTPKSPKCDSGASRFHSKKSLLYAYEGETLSGVVGTSAIRSGLKLRAKCEISPVLPCVYMLKVIEAELLETQGMKTKPLVYQISRGSSELRLGLLARELYFRSDRGVISKIIPDKGEPTHVLNIKRGILSAFQLKMISKDDTINEVDVNGECKAKYHVKHHHKNGEVKTIVKTKNLTVCNDRSETNLGIPVTSYPTDKPFSFLSSNSVCTSVVSTKNKLAKVYCEETHLFRPFSSRYQNSSGAMTTVRQTLNYIRSSVESHDGVSLSGKDETSLKYEHSPNLENPTKNYREVREIIEKLVSEESAKPDSARLFSKLIFAVRRLNTKAMKSIWHRYYECEENGRCLKGQAEKYQKYIVDAFSHCGTLHCAQFMVHTISDKIVGTQQSIAFLTGIALVGTPSENMVGNILYFCQETPSRTAFLTLGTLVNKYCRQHNCDKLNERSAIYQTDRFLQSKLNHNCKAASPEDVDLVVLALKAIGNAGRPLSAVTNLLKCAVEPGSIAIKIEALQALRRISCSTEMTNGLFDIFKAPTTDTEVRIETYLALMRCPSEMVIQKIADELDNEKNNQVGSFVWSHLTNALESTEPVYGVRLRDIISKALAGRKLRPFIIDRLRYSHAYETSYYNKKHEVGGSSQAQVIFHPDSYFPRSAKFNLTVDVLGASINLLEMAARFEGFESLIEQTFGSEGYFPDERLMKLLKVKPTSSGNNLREGRSIREEEMDEIKSSLEKLQDKMNIERKNPSGALSFKVFGHELQFLNFDDIDWLQGEADKINIIDTLINIARGGKYTFSKNFMFLEADHEVPTALGLPLKLAVNGSAVSSLNLKGKFDIRNMFWGKKKFDIRGYVTPSAVVDISGKMTVDAIHASSGIHFNSSLYTATEINANATYTEGEGIKLSIDPPTKPIYIVNITSNLATFLNEKFERLSGPPRRLERQACANLTNMIGVNLCGHISTPMAFRDYNAPYFPLTGQSSFGMTFQTTNADLARFEMEGRKVTSNDDNRHDWIFNVHIPGLTFGKRMEANCTFQFLKHGKFLNVSGGIHGYKFGKFEAMYNNDTNGLYTKFSTPELAYLKPITIETEVFNKTNTKTNEQKVGVSINATYKKFTIQEVITLFKHNDQYGFKSNLTYWPRMHIATEGRLSVVKKSVYLKMDDTNSKSKLFFAGKLGKSTKFYVKIGNDIMNYEVKLDGEVNMKNRKIMVDMFTKPSRNLMKFEAYPRVNDIERGFYMRLLNVNTSLQFSGYLGASHTVTDSSLKFNGMAMNGPIVIRATHYNRERKVELVASGFGHNGNTSLEVVSESGLLGLNYYASFNDKNVKSTIVLFKKLHEMGLNLNASLMDKTVDVFAAYFRKGQDTGLRLKLKGGDKTIDTVATYFTGNEEKGLKFTMNGMGHSGSLIWAYYNKKTEAGLSMKASVLDKSMEIAAGVFTHDSEKGLSVRANVLDNEMEARWSILYDSKVAMKFAASAFKKNIELKSFYLNDNRTKTWRIDAVYNGNTKSLVSTYTGYPSRKTLCSELSDLRKVHFKVCTKLIRGMGEIALQLNAEGFGRKGEVRTSLIHSADEKGGRLQIKYNDAPLSDVFMGIVNSSTYNGLRLRANIYEKSMDALLKYKNTGLKRSVELQLSVEGNLVSFESMWVRETSLQGFQVNVLHQDQPVGSAYVLLSRKTGLKVLKIGAKSARKNGAEYKLSIENSRIEKKFHSMVIVTANEKHYKYGWSILYTNKGTNEQPNHMVMSKLHYGHAKFLTSVAQMINTEHSFSLIYQAELLPDRFVTNKFTYSKLSEELFIQHELVPGIRMTYSGALQRTRQLLGLRSTLTILDYPMNSSIILDKQTGRLRCTFVYSPTKPPVELTIHLQIRNKIDVGFLLSALNMTLEHKFLLDYSSKQIKLAFNVLPNVPVQMFAKMFENNQFVFNLTTCSAFSVQLTGRHTRNEYQLIFRHQYFNNIFDDLKVTTPSLQVLKKLQLKWDSLQVFNKLQIEWDLKMATELRKVMNISMQDLFTKTVEITKKMAINSVNYMRKDGRDFVKMAKHFSIELLKGDMINTVVKTYSTRVNDTVQKLKETMMKMTDELKKYGSPLMETYTQLEKILKEITSELSPHLKSFPLDIQEWLWRSFNRYRMVSICGKTIEGITWETLKKTRMGYKIFVQKCKIQVTLLLSKLNLTKPAAALREFYRLVEKMKTTTKEFTCNYDMKRTLENVQNTIKKRMDNAEMKKMGELFKKISDRVVGQYKTMEKLVSMQLKNSKLQEKAEEFLRAMKEALKSMATNVPVERINMLKKRLRHLEVEIKVHYQNLMQQVEHVTLKELRDKLQMLVEKIFKLLRDQGKQVLHEITRRTQYAAAKISEETAYDLRKRGTNLYLKLMNKLNDILEEAKKIIKEYVELVKSRIAKLRQEQVERLRNAFEKVKRSMKETMYKYKNQLTLFVDKIYQNLSNVVTSYKDMPIEDIITRRMVNNALGPVMEATLSVYRRASDYVQKMDFQNLKMLEASCKRIFYVTRDILFKYKAVTEKQLKPMLKKYLAEIEEIGDRILSYSKTRYNDVKLSYDKIKYMKFMEMYDKARKMLEEWKKEMEKCRETCRAKVNEWKTRITNFIEEVKEESINVYSRVRKVNEEVQKDAIATFRPYKVLVKNTLDKHKRLISERMAELPQHYPKTVDFVNKYRKAVEDYKTMAFKKLINVDKKEIIDMVLESLNRCSLLVKFVDRGFVVKSQEFVKSSTTKLRKLPGDYEVSIMKFANDTRNKMALRMEKMLKDLEYIGEANLYDIEVRVMEYFEKILAPAKSTYKELSNIVDKQLKVLAEKRNALKDLSNELFDKAQVIVDDGKQLFKDTWKKATEWTTRRWTNSKPLIDFIFRFSGKFRNDVEIFTTRTLYTYGMFVEQYYKELLKMTPNQLIQYTKEMHAKSYDLSRRLLETVKTTTVDRLRMSLRALSTFIDEFDPVNVLRQARLKTEIGIHVIRSVLQDAGNQMRNISTEIIETLLFLNRFYGIEETMYSRTPLKSLMVIRLNQAKEKVRDYLNANVSRDAEKIYTKVMAMLNNMKDIGRRQYQEIVILVNKLDEKYPHIAKYKNLTMLISHAIDCSREARVVLRGYVTANFEYCMNMDIIIHAMRQIKVALDSGEYKLAFPKLDVIYKIGSNMKICLNKQYVRAYAYVVQYVQFVPMMPRMTYEMYKDTLWWLQHVAKTNWEKVKQDLTTFRQSSETIWTPVRASFTKNLKDVDRMRRESMDICTTIVVSYYNKGNYIFDAIRKINIRQVIANYTKTLSKETDGLVDNMKRKVSEMIRKIRKLRKQAMDKNWKMNMTKDIMNLYEPTKTNLFIIIEDLMNKTIEISQDVYNLSLIQDLLKFGRQCYSESNRVFGLTMESSEFALYITKYVIQHSGIWDVARKLTDPFYWLPPSNSVAMIFGTPHVYTFDGKYFEFPGYKKPTCTYVLAQDFRDKIFTLLSREKSLILNTKSGHITIDASGKVVATVEKDAKGNKVNVVYNELPVEMMHVRVKREGSFIKIRHDQGLDVTCDLKHFFCTFNINRFYHGKMAGLLGTNNNELYDEFTKPDKSIAKTSIDFVNSWEVSGDPECKVTELKKTACDGSPRCNALFLKNTSPLARYFSSLNPEPFYQACVYDTSDCQTGTSSTKSTPSHCNVVAAYTALLREKGVWARQLPECASCGSKEMWKKWTQKGNKGVDVVLLVPETLNTQSHAVKLPTFLQELETHLSGYKPRYAVVGFGGKSGVHQLPHIVTGGGNVFGSIQDVDKAIRNMKFTNEKTDALKAIEYIQRLPFNPGATKIVILLTNQNRAVNSTASMSRAIKTLNMHGMIFNVIGPYFQKKPQTLGLWKGEAYLMKEKLQSKLHAIALPSNDYTRLAESSQGGIFNLEAYSQTYGKLKNSLGKAFKTALIKQIDNDQVYCRQCVCLPSYADEPVTFCRIYKHARC